MCYVRPIPGIGMRAYSVSGYPLLAPCLDWTGDQTTSQLYWIIGEFITAEDVESSKSKYRETRPDSPWHDRYFISIINCMSAVHRCEVTVSACDYETSVTGFEFTRLGFFRRFPSTNWNGIAVTFVVGPRTHFASLIYVSSSLLRLAGSDTKHCV